LNIVTIFHQNKIPGKGIFNILFLLIILTLQAYSQQNEILITKEYNDMPWNDFVEKIENNFNVRFFYHPDSIPEINVFIKSSPAGLQNVLTENFRPYNINVSIDRIGNIFLTKGQTLVTNLPKDFFEYTYAKTGNADTLEKPYLPNKNPGSLPIKP